jgi:D-arabinono-1,4-lactone oxidase
VEVKAMPCAEANEAFYALDPTLVGMNMDNPFPNTRPWHFESYINPYRLTSPDGCMLRVMNKVRLDEDEIQSIAGIEGGFQPVYMALDPHALMARAYSSILSLQFLLRGGGDRFWNFPFVRTLQKVAYGLVNSAVVDMIFQASEAESNGYPLELYGSANSDSYFAQYPQSTITMEVAVPLEHLHEALPLVLKVLNDNPSATQIDLRYVKSTNATLGFTRHSDVTALIDFPSAYTPTTLATYRLIQEALEEHRDTISFTYHWGKFLPENAEWVHKSYGAALEQWQKQRERLLTTPLERHIFSSDFIESLGI